MGQKDNKGFEERQSRKIKRGIKKNRGNKDKEGYEERRGKKITSGMKGYEESCGRKIIEV